MRRVVGYGWLAVAVGLTLLSGLVRQYGNLPLVDVTVETWMLRALSAVALLAGAYGLYGLVTGVVRDRTESKRRRHDVRNVLRFLFGVVTAVGLLGVVTDQWVGVLFSLGVIGFAVTVALQQPLFSLVGWIYIVTNRPYQVGDRIAIDDTRGDVVSIGFFVTEVWEIDGPLVSSTQPSGRIVTVPNSVVLSSHVVNFYGDGVPYVWNEISVQVAYETDLDFATGTMIQVADDLLGDEMAEEIAAYRHRLEETPVELDVNETPTVNVAQRESWVELRLRYLVHPRRGTRMRNALYEGILERFNEHPDRVKFPVSRNR